MNILSMLTLPEKKWLEANKEHHENYHMVLLLILPLIPALAISFGTWLVGWSMYGQEEFVKLNINSAFSLGIMVYFSFVSSVLIMSWFISWLSTYFKANKTFNESLTFCLYLAFPYMALGIAALYPDRWLAITCFGIASLYSLMLLYTGLQSFLGISGQKSMLFGFCTLFFFMLLFGSVVALNLGVWIDGINFSAGYVTEPVA